MSFSIKCSIIFLVIIFIVLGCIGEYPENSDAFRYLYAGNKGYDEIFIIDVEENVIQDTLKGFMYVNSIVATKSGNNIFVCTREGLKNCPGAVYSVNTKTREIIKIIEKPSDVYISPDGTPLIIVSIPYDSIRYLGIIDTLNYEITYIDSLDILDTGNNYQTLTFSTEEKIFYTWSNKPQIFAYNFEERKVIKRYSSVAFPSKNMIISNDGNYLYFANGPVVDIHKDTITGYIPANNSSTLGMLALSPDGGYIYLTDPGKPLMLDPLPSGEIKVFDTSSLINVESINVNNASGRFNTMTERIVISCDGKKAYVSGNFKDIYVIDLTLNKVIDVIKFENNNTWITTLALAK